MDEQTYILVNTINTCRYQSK